MATTVHPLAELLRRRIAVIDGAMGTMIQARGLTEADFRGARLASWPKDLKGNNELLNLSRPDVIEEIHAAYFEAGADIVETNTFNGNGISQSDYGTEELVYEINVEAARIAKKGTRVRATLTQGGRVYASADFKARRGSLKLVLKNRRGVKPGTYTLTLQVGAKKTTGLARR